MENQTKTIMPQEFDPNQQLPPSPVMQTPTKKPVRKYTRTDAVFAWVCFALGFVFARYVAQLGGGLWGGIFWACFGGVGAVWVRKNRLDTSAAQKAVFAVAELFCLSPLFCANPFINTLSAWFSFLLMFYLCLTISGAELFGKHFVSDLLKGVFVRPFQSIGNAPAAGFSPIKSKTSLKTAGFVMIGLILAVPLTILTLVILIMSDAFFADVIGDFLHSLPGFSFSLIWQLIFGSAVGMFLFGALYSAAKPAPGYNPSAPRCRILPPVIAYTMITPMCIFYLVYVIVQFVGLGRVLENPSEYARRGFFELCVIAVINLCIIVILQLFTARCENDRTPLPLKIYITLISGFTMLFIACAFSKMALYISSYGLTPLRFYTSWFMAVLAVVFVVIIISQYAQIPVWRVLFIGFTVLLAALCFGNTDGIIARYNVSVHRELSDSLDLEALADLNGMAAEPLSELLISGEELSGAVSREAVQSMLQEQLNEMEQQDGFAYFSFPRLAAENAIHRAGITSDR